MMEIANLASIYLDLGNLYKAEEMYKASIKISDNHYGKNHIETVM